ncbi:amino acid transporter heavy chain SLC3A1-like [Asterias amurensis]|uniref:amino acid transporter heavy chain SLC3A1-like n=1 Tax=Asterias amurensis TaxID=7602 RepID=UPI003AB2BA1E
MDNKGFDDIEMQPPGNSTDLPANGDYEIVEKSSMKGMDENEISKKPLEEYIEPHDGPYAGMGKEELLRYSRGASWQIARWSLLLLLLAGWCAMLGMSIYIIVVTPRCLPWWQTSVIYQIYPRSFKDSDGDGIGDLKGITDNVAYLKDLGVGAVLLNSIYQSPQVDLGYDVSDFEKVDPIFGTTTDFENLVEALHGEDIKLILDFIPNQSSNIHEFFNKSMAGDSDYLNWYTWADEKNNWLSTYSGEAWELNSNRAQFYLHQYSKEQPDFNLRNNAVVQYLTDVLDKWFVLGVDGFSITGVKYMFETDTFSSNDQPAPGYVDDGLGAPKQYNSLLHDKSSEFNGLQHKLLKEWRDGKFNQFSTAGTYRVMLSDSDSNSTYARTYYGSEEEPEVDLPMNFNLLKLGDTNGGWSPSTIGTGYTTGIEVYELVKDWMDNLPSGKWPTFMLGHHGVHRIASRLGEGYARAANMLLLTLPGTPIVYYGDEIGMTDVEITEAQLMDVKALNDIPRWQTKTRDRQRSPMQWTNKSYSGFTESETGSWLPLPPQSKFTDINVQTLASDKNSILSMFKAMTQLRADNRPLRQGKVAKFVHNTLNIVSYIREVEKERERFFVAINFGQDMSFENDFYDKGQGELPIEGTILVSTDMRRNGERIQLNKVALDAGEGIVVLLDEIVEVDEYHWFQYFKPT